MTTEQLKKKLSDIFTEYQCEHTDELIDHLFDEEDAEDWFDKDGDFNGIITTEDLWGYGFNISGVGQYSIDILTNQESEDAYEEALDNYIEEVILPEIPQPYQYYFNNDKWKNDAMLDGIHHSLSGYDGGGSEEGDYYIFHN